MGETPMCEPRAHVNARKRAYRRGAVEALKLAREIVQHYGYDEGVCCEMARGRIDAQIKDLLREYGEGKVDRDG